RSGAPVQSGERTGPAGMGGRGRCDLVVADVPEVRGEPPGRDGRDSSHWSPRSPGRSTRCRPGAPAHTGSAGRTDRRVCLTRVPGTRAERWRRRMRPMSSVAGPSETGPLIEVLLKHPSTAFVDDARVSVQWKSLGYSAPPDLRRAIDEYDH